MNCTQGIVGMGKGDPEEDGGEGFVLGQAHDIHIPLSQLNLTPVS